MEIHKSYIVLWLLLNMENLGRLLEHIKIWGDTFQRKIWFHCSCTIFYFGKKKKIPCGDWPITVIESFSIRLFLYNFAEWTPTDPVCNILVEIAILSKIISKGSLFSLGADSDKEKDCHVHG